MNNKFKFILIAMLMYIGIYIKKLASGEAWRMMHPPINKRVRKMKDTFWNRHLAAYINSHPDQFDYMLVLETHSLVRVKVGKYILLMSMPTVTQVIIATYD